MLLILASWILLLFFSFAFGLGVRKLVLVFGTEDVFRGKDELLLAGVVSVSVVAETFSLFRGLDLAAFLILAALAVALSLVCQKDFVRTVRNVFHTLFQTEKGVFFLLASLVLLCCEAWLSAVPAYYFDTGNYHFPAIRWIEECGVVTGLGNLHTRLAYNSASLCLHALFSFSWLVGRPLGTTNAFFWCFSVLFCLWGLFRDARHGILLSSAFRAQLLFLVLPRAWSVTAPNTDFMALFLTGFVFVKWCEYAQWGTSRDAPFVWLAMASAFAVSVKLSSVALAGFAVFPLWKMIRRRNWTGCLALAFGLGLVLVPFFVRNICLSGYLVYPFPALDLFPVDWKVPEIVALSDATAIKLYARMPGAWDYSQTMDSFPIWFPRWWQSLSSPYKAVFAAGGLGCLASVLRMFLPWDGKRQRLLFAEVAIVSIAGFAFALASAPAFRFGDWWIVSGLTLGVWTIWHGLTARLPLRHRQKGKMLSGFLLAGMCAWCVPGILATIIRPIDMANHMSAHWLSPAGIPDDSTTQAWALLSGKRFYYAKRTPMGPVDGGLNGYRGFPGTECKTTLDRIEMRGPLLSDGFRPNPKSRNLPYDFQGKLLSNDEVKCLRGYVATSSRR